MGSGRDAAERRPCADTARRTTFDPDGDTSPAIIRDRELRKVCVSPSLAFPDRSRRGDTRLSAPDETGRVELDTVAIGRKLRDDAMVPVDGDGNEAAEWRKIADACLRREGRQSGGLGGDP